VGKNIFLNLAAECSLLLDYSIHKSFRDVNNVNFISKVIGEKHEVYHLQLTGMF